MSDSGESMREEEKCILKMIVDSDKQLSWGQQI